MENKTLKNLLIAILVAICGAIATFFTTSCTAMRETTSHGKATVITNDTTIITHDGYINLKIK